MAEKVEWEPSQVKEFTEAILDEKDRALTMAGDEREKAASALRSEQQRREDQASEERERAAENLRVGLDRSIKEGDDRLREHITNQYAQVKAALESAEKLELERLARVDSDVHALGEKLEVLRLAQTMAQDKFERSVESRFAQVNEFRQSLDDLGKTMATRRELESSSAAAQEAREQLVAQIADLRSRIDVGPEGLRTLQTNAAVSSGRSAGSQMTMANLATWLGLGVAIIVAAIVFANYATRRSNPATPNVTCSSTYHPSPCP